MSNVFRDMFKCEFPEEELRKITIDDVSAADFELLFKALDNPKATLTGREQIIICY